MSAIRSSKFAVALVAAALALGLTHSFAGDRGQGALKAQARISEAQATQTALAQVPNAVVRSSELERANGQLVWSLNLTQPSVPGKTEVQIDAISGQVVSVKKETDDEDDDDEHQEENRK
jgi:uncharacterized membrane protein YkoI